MIKEHPIILVLKQLCDKGLVSLLSHNRNPFVIKLFTNNVNKDNCKYPEYGRCYPRYRSDTPKLEKNIDTMNCRKRG